MRPDPPNQFRLRGPQMGVWSSCDADGMIGAFAVVLKGRGHKVVAQCIVHDGVKGECTGWEHVSIKIREFGKTRLPTWAEMCIIKDTFWLPEETVVQFHPAKENYVNIHADVLHLWRYSAAPFPTPPIHLV